MRIIFFLLLFVFSCREGMIQNIKIAFQDSVDSLSGMKMGIELSNCTFQFHIESDAFSAVWFKEFVSTQGRFRVNPPFFCRSKAV